MNGCMTIKSSDEYTSNTLMQYNNTVMSGTYMEYYVSVQARQC